jgi:hypothetical protein
MMTDTADRTEQGGTAATTEGFAELVDGLRATFRTGRTRSIE